MSCHEIETRLDELLDGTLAADERDALDRHLAGCAACRELVQAARVGTDAGIDLADAVLRRTSGPACGRAGRLLASRIDDPLDPGDVELLDEHVSRCAPCAALAGALAANASTLRTLVEVPVDLAAGVLQRTTGDACERAAGRLPELAAGTLDSGDAELVRGHAAACERCGPLAGALGELVELLPRLAEADPGPWFTAAVLRRTTRRRPTTRLGRLWATLMARPRFAYEAAYVGAIVLFLLFGTPLSPLREVSRGALTLARTNPVRVAEAGLSPIPPLLMDYGERAVDYGQRAWDATGGRMIDGTRPARQALAERVGAAWSAMASFRTHVRGLWSSFLEGDLEAMGTRLQEMGETLKTIWIRLFSDPSTERTEPNTEGGAS